MNKTSLVKVLLSGIIMVLLLMACRPRPSRGYVNDFERFVERVEKNASSFSEKQWERNDKQFQGFVDKYNKVNQRLSTEENEKVGGLIARYTKAKLGSGKIFGIIIKIRAWLKCLEGFKKEITDYKSIIQGFVDGIEDSIEKYPIINPIYYEYKEYLENN